MKQKQYMPLSVGMMATILFAADQGYLDDVPLNRVALFEQELKNHLQTQYRDFITRIDQTGEFNDEVAQTLRTILESFKANQSWN